VALPPQTFVPTTLPVVAVDPEDPSLLPVTDVSSLHNRRLRILDASLHLSLTRWLRFADAEPCLPRQLHLGRIPRLMRTASASISGVLSEDASPSLFTRRLHPSETILAPPSFRVLLQTDARSSSKSVRICGPVQRPSLSFEDEGAIQPSQDRCILLQQSPTLDRL